MKKLLAVVIMSVFAINMSAFAVAPVTNDIAVGTSFGVSELYRSVVRIATVDTTVNAANTGDVFYVMNIPSNTSVEQVFVEVTTANTNGSTISVGDTTSATKYLSSVSLTNAALSSSAISAAITQAIVSSNLVYTSTAGSMTAQSDTNGFVTNVSFTAGSVVTNPVVRSIAAGTSAITDKGAVYASGGKIAVTFAAPETVAKFNVIAILNKLDGK